MDYASCLLHPAIQSLLLGLAALLLICLRRPRTGIAFAVVAVGWITFASTPAFALRLRDGLLGVGAPAPSRVGAIVVLGGGMLPSRGTMPADTRAGMAWRLWHEGRAPLLVASGRDQAEELFRRFTLAGIPPSALRVEDRSRTTHENARDTAALLRNDGIDAVALVSSDIHLRRAAGCFRREGIAVWPVAALDDDGALREAPRWLPRRDALTLAARSLREYVALWVYRRHGWI